MKIYAVIPKSRGQEARVSRDSFRGHELVDVRTWYEDSAGEMRPTKQGVAIRLEDLPRLLDALRRAEADAIAAGELLPEDYTNAGLEPPPELRDVA